MKDKLKTGVIVFIILLFILGCMSLKTHINVQSYNNYAEKYETGIENFTFLIKELTPTLCPPDMSCDNIPASSASGFVLSSDKSFVFVMTAAHFCDIMPDNPNIFIESIVGFINDTPRNLHILYSDSEKDICLLYGLKMKNESFKNIKIAENMKIGEDLYTVAAPDGIAGPGKRLIFTGQFGGCDNKICLSTIPATFGSSGGPIYNANHELVTIVMAVPQNFNNVILSPSNKDIIKFIEDIDSVIDIYPYK